MNIFANIPKDEWQTNGFMVRLGFHISFHNTEAYSTPIHKWLTTHNSEMKWCLIKITFVDEGNPFVLQNMLVRFRQSDSAAFVAPSLPQAANHRRQFRGRHCRQMLLAARLWADDSRRCRGAMMLWQLLVDLSIWLPPFFQMIQSWQLKKRFAKPSQIQKQRIG